MLLSKISHFSSHFFKVKVDLVLLLFVDFFCVLYFLSEVINFLLDLHCEQASYFNILDDFTREIMGVVRELWDQFRYQTGIVFSEQIT